MAFLGSSPQEGRDILEQTRQLSWRPPGLQSPGAGAAFKVRVVGVGDVGSWESRKVSPRQPDQTGSAPDIGSGQHDSVVITVEIQGSRTRGANQTDGRDNCLLLRQVGPAGPGLMSGEACALMGRPEAP